MEATGFDLAGHAVAVVIDWYLGRMPSDGQS